MSRLKIINKQKLLIFGAILFVMALALTAYTFAQQNSYKYVLYKESGTVYYKQEGQEYQTLNDEEVELNGVTYIKTESDSIAHVLFPNNSLMSVDENSEVKVEYTPQDTTVFQLLGKTYHRVKRLLQDQSYIVVTKSAVAAVRGTKFGVILGDDNTATILVTESEVDVNSILHKNGINKIVTGGKVTEGKMVVLPNNLEDESAVTFIPVDIPKEIKQTKWFRNNVIFDWDYDVRQVSTASLTESLEEMQDEEAQKDKDKAKKSEEDAEGDSGTSPIDVVESEPFDPNVLLNLSHPHICRVTNSQDFLNFYVQITHDTQRYGVYYNTLYSYLGLLRSYCADDSLSAGDKTSLQLLLILLPRDIFETDYSNTLIPSPTPTPIPTPVPTNTPTPTP